MTTKDVAETYAAPPVIALDVRGAASALAVSPRTIEALAQTGAIPSFRIGRRRLFEVASLRKWAQDRTAETQEAQP